MPTAVELERLAALVTRLQPLSRVQRGELIQALAWNTVVEATIELARAVLAEDRRDTVPEHDHRDSVTLDWLDPRLRQLLQRGPLTDPVSENRLRETERRTRRYDQQFGEVQVDLKGIRQRLDEVITRDLKRESEVIQFDRRLQELPTTREELLNLRGTLDSVRTDVQAALDLTELLRVDGEPADLTAIVRRIETVEQLRERLTTPTGQIFDAAGFEIRLQELTNRFVGRDELDDILDGRTFEISPDQIGTLRGELSQSLLSAQAAALESSLSQFRGSVLTETNTRLSQIDGLVATAAANLEADLRGALQETLRTQMVAEIAERVQAAGAGFADRLGSVEAQLGGLGLEELRTRLAELGGLVGTLGETSTGLGGRLDQLQAGVGTLGARVSGLDERLGGFETRFGGLETNLDGLNGRLGGLEDRVGTIDGRFTTVDASLSTLNGRTAGVESTVGSVDARLGTIEQRATSFGARVTAVEQRAAGLDARVTDFTSGLSGQDRRLATVEESLRGLRDIEGLTTLGERLTEMNRNLEALAVQLGGVMQGVQQVQGRLGVVERDLGGLNSRLGGLEGRIDSVTADFGRLSQSFTAVEAGVSAFRQDFSRLQADVSRFDTRLQGVERGTVINRPVGGPAGGGTLDPNALIERSGHVERVPGEGRAAPTETDFRLIRGIGRALDARLRENGITTFSQLAAAEPDEIARALSVSPDRALAMIAEARRLMGT